MNEHVINMTKTTNPRNEEEIRYEELWVELELPKLSENMERKE
jgi:hypothetical protein